jgi:hypothetical protein
VGIGYRNAIQNLLRAFDKPFASGVSRLLNEQKQANCDNANEQEHGNEFQDYSASFEMPVT